MTDTGPKEHDNDQQQLHSETTQAPPTNDKTVLILRGTEQNVSQMRKTVYVDGEPGEKTREPDVPSATSVAWIEKTPHSLLSAVHYFILTWEYPNY